MTTISEIRRGMQEAPDLSSQAYIQVDDILYPVADVVLQEDGLIIVASTDEGTEDEVAAFAELPVDAGEPAVNADSVEELLAAIDADNGNGGSELPEAPSEPSADEKPSRRKGLQTTDS